MKTLLAVVLALATATLAPGQDEVNTNVWSVTHVVAPDAFRLAGPVLVDHAANRLMVPIEAVASGGTPLLLPGRDNTTIMVELSFAEHNQAMAAIAPPWPTTPAEVRSLYRRAALRAAVKKFRGN
jgi:hypothetical protein